MKVLSVQKRFLIALIATAPVLLAVSWLVQNGFRKTSVVLFAGLFLVDFYLLKPKLASSATASREKEKVSGSAIWVVGLACFLGSLSVLASGIRTHETWEIVGGCLGILASAWGVSELCRRHLRLPCSSKTACYGIRFSGPSSNSRLSPYYFHIISSVPLLFRPHIISISACALNVKGRAAHLA